MNSFLKILKFVAVFFTSLLGPAQGFVFGRSLSPSDLAVVLEPSPFKDTKIAMTGDLFRSDWWEQSLLLFEQTPVGKALTIENSLDEWQLVAVRLAPCQPLIPYLTAQNDRFCSAELRLVWQPIVYSRPGSWKGIADDRAFHSSYRLNGSTLLPLEKAVIYQNLLEKGRAQLALDVASKPLTESELVSYETLHIELVSNVIDQLKSLALLPLGNEVATRPEYSEVDKRQVFSSALKNFLDRHATPNQLIELTGFSLTEGRDPPLLDEWIFIALEPRAVKEASPTPFTLVPKDILLKSKKTGQQLLNFGPHSTVSMHRDDDRIFDMMDSLTADFKQEVEQSVILRFADKKSKKTEISRVQDTQVPHTTCGSCHKLNTQPFDFHNLSYYLDHPSASVSPRVVQDVSRDLMWLKERGIH